MLGSPDTMRLELLGARDAFMKLFGIVSGKVTVVQVPSSFEYVSEFDMIPTSPHSIHFVWLWGG